jgi:hypothetical protein
MLSGEATNTNFIVFGLTRLGLEPTIYRTRSKNISITSAFLIKNCLLLDQAAKILNKEDKLNYFHKHSILIVFG